MELSGGSVSADVGRAIEPGTVLPIHRHRITSETVVSLHVHFEEYFFDSEGRLTNSIDMVPGGKFINTSVGHSLRSLESSTVLLECKAGLWALLG